METTPETAATPRLRNRKRALIGTAALAIGLAVGGAGLAGAVTGTGGSTDHSTAVSAPAAPGAADGARPDPASMPNGPGETVLTGATAEQATAAALAEVPGGAIIRVETDSSGTGVYEAYMTKADGTPVTLQFDKDFNVTATEAGFGRGPQGHGPPPPPPAAAAGGAGTSN
ncbi:MAG: hypothetical protein JJE46_08855 [Acidimicrobiia bacterium]|nr:hypothetical protein [Acidimicrobiia bacterium]